MVAALHPFLQITDAATRSASFQFKVRGHLAPTAGGSSAGIAFEGSHVYIAGEEKGLGIFDVSDPANPTLVGKFNEGGSWTRDVDVADDVAYIATFEQGLQIVDVHNPASPALLGHYGLFNYDSVGVQVEGQTAFLASALVIIPVDVSNPLKTDEKYSAKTPPNGAGRSAGILVSGNDYYVPVNNGLWYVQRYSSSAASLTGLYSPDSIPSWDVAVNAQTAFLGRSTKGSVLGFDNK